MGTTESITYSDAFAAVASCIPAFAKRGDLLLLDSGCNFAVQTGARLSRSKVVLFKHNDMADLRKQLEAVRMQDKTKRDTSLEQRRFIVVEGLYANYGDVCPLAEVDALAREFKWRIMMDDSLGFAALGKTGRGATEHAGLQPNKIDVLLGSLATSLGSVGGFCVGSREVVDHQRLSGAGYCFSASAPPFLCTAATTALHLLEDEPELAKNLQARSAKIHEGLKKALNGSFKVNSLPVSPIQLASLAVAGLDEAYDQNVKDLFKGSGSAVALPDLAPAQVRNNVARRKLEEAILSRFVEAVADEGSVLVTYTQYLPTDSLAPRPSLKINVSLAHTEAEVEQLYKALAAACKNKLPQIVKEAKAAAAGASQ
jgi:serine palmitoyltransferase